MKVYKTKILLFIVFFSTAFFPSQGQEFSEHLNEITKRQIVDLWISEADRAFRSPARVSHAGFTAMLPTNMEIVAQSLLRAADLEPFRPDLLLGAANAFIYNKEPDRAVEVFERLFEKYPDSTDVNSYLAAWYRFLGDKIRLEKHTRILERLNRSRLEELQKVFGVIDHVSTMQLLTMPNEGFAPDAIVTLGYILNPDGSMHPILVERLEKTLKLALAYPESIIVLSGGVPNNNFTEASVMADWLFEKGISRDRLFEDNYAKDTVQNALYSRYILAANQIHRAVIVSSGSHVRRGHALLQIASWVSGPSGIVFQSVYSDKNSSSNSFDVSEDELMGIYRDSLRVMGLWSFSSEPLVHR